MPDCPHCDRSFEGEEAIREHFYVDHDREELGRIDTRRVDQFLREKGVAEPDPEPDPDLLEGPPDFESAYEAVRTELDPWNPDNKWHPAEVRELSSDEITDRLAERGIYTERDQFRRRAERSGSVDALADSWMDDDWVTAEGYERDFIWMAGLVLWDRWAADVDRTERVAELATEAVELEQEGELLASYERSYEAWEEFERVTDPDAISLQAAVDAWDGPIDVVELCQVLAHPSYNDAWGDPDRAELRLEFCRGLLDRYPAMAVPVHRLLRLGEAESLFVLGRPDEADEVYESLVESDPTDAHIYAEWGNVYRQGCPPAGIPPDEDGADDIYVRGREADAEPGEVLIELLERPLETEQSAPAEGCHTGRDEDPPPA